VYQEVEVAVVALILVLQPLVVLAEVVMVAEVHPQLILIMESQIQEGVLAVEVKAQVMVAQAVQVLL
jgi:hypothetical protein